MPENTFASLVAIYEKGYEDNSNGFHPADVAGKIGEAAAEMSRLAAEADRLCAKAASGGYATASTFWRDADGLSQLLGAECQLLASVLDTAKAADQRKIGSAGLLYQPNLTTAAAAQEKSDATLLSNLQQLLPKIANAFTTAAAALPAGPPTPPTPTPPTPTPPTPTPPTPPGPTQGFERRMSEFFLRAWPEEVSGLGGAGGLARAITAGIGKAQSYNLAAEDEIGRFLLASVVLGPDFDRQPWAQTILNDRTLSSADKIDRVQDGAVARLASP